MATAVVSSLSKTPIRRDVAMTGEITLRGKVLPIGGLKEKSMAAYISGAKQVIIPQRNISDLDEVETIVKENVEFVPVSDVMKVLETALVRMPGGSDDKRKKVKAPIEEKGVSVHDYAQ